MSTAQYLADIAEETERLTGTTPNAGLRRELTDEARLKRISASLQGLARFATVLPDLGDVSAALSPVSGQILSYDGSSWTAITAAEGVTRLSDLGDVVATAPASGEALVWNGSSWAPAAVTPVLAKTLHVEFPNDSEDATFFFTNTAIALSELRIVLVGDTSPSVTWEFFHATTRSAAGTSIKSGTTTSTTSGDDLTTFTDGTIPADSFVWLETSAQAGNVYEMTATAVYN